MTRYPFLRRPDLEKSMAAINFSLEHYSDKDLDSETCTRHLARYWKQTERVSPLTPGCGNIIHCCKTSLFLFLVIIFSEYLSIFHRFHLIFIQIIKIAIIGNTFLRAESLCHQALNLVNRSGEFCWGLMHPCVEGEMNDGEHGDRSLFTLIQNTWALTTPQIHFFSKKREIR